MRNRRLLQASVAGSLAYCLSSALLVTGFVAFLDHRPHVQSSLLVGLTFLSFLVPIGGPVLVAVIYLSAWYSVSSPDSGNKIGVLPTALVGVFVGGVFMPMSWYLSGLPGSITALPCIIGAASGLVGTYAFVHELNGINAFSTRESRSG